MKQPSTKMTQKRFSKQRGVALPIFAGIFFSLLTILGVSVDLGNLYRSKLRLQRSVDAAAIGGTYLFGEQSDDKIIEAARKIALSNVSGQSYVSTPTFQITVNSGNIQVRGSAEVPLVILRLVPGFESSKTISVFANAGTVRTIISLVVDTSLSMNCPATGACPNDNCDETNTCQKPTKLDKLKEAAQSFVELLNENTDQVSLVGFSTDSHIYKAMDVKLDKKDLINNIIPGITATAKTNIQIGLKEGKNQLSLADTSIKSRKSLILISDGAPNRSDNQNIQGCNYDDTVSNAQKKPHYIKAIKESDLIRSDSSATIYTIGVGVADPSKKSSSYQDLSDSHDNYLKPYLLRRLANAPSAANNPKSPNDFECVPSYKTYNSSASYPKGEYLETADANKLESLLLSVARSIRAILID